MGVVSGMTRGFFVMILGGCMCVSANPVGVLEHILITHVYVYDK